MKISITDYMAVSAKGRACKPRRTRYEVAEDFDIKEVYARHAEAIASGALEAPYKTAGWARVWS